MSTDLKEFMSAKGRPGSLWYVACPYSHCDPKVVQQRVADLKTCVARITELYGAVPFSPIMYTLSLQEAGVKPTTGGWYQFDLAFLRKADRLIVLEFEGWETSVGVALEIAFAQAQNLPIVYLTKEQLMSAEDIPF